MPAQYLLRFDDICPTMNWRVWHEIDHTLREVDIKPIVAVVPDNQDRALCVDPPCPKFWDHVRKWQELGWSIGMHGYQHRYVTSDAGLTGLNRFSEFAGLDRDQQAEKITRALKIFHRENIEPKLWVAPAHSFDRRTVEVLRTVGLNTISDGFAVFPRRDPTGMFWIPQQLWRFRALPMGVWTVCIHHNSWSSDALALFKRNLHRFRPVLTSVGAVESRYGRRSTSWTDDYISRLFMAAWRTKVRMHRVLRARHV